MRAKDQAEIDNYFSAIKLKKQINNSSSASQALNLKQSGIAESTSGGAAQQSRTQI
jgi:hypothetical protein